MSDQVKQAKRAGASRAPRFGITDLDTGEVLTQDLRLKGNSPRKYYSEEYILMFIQGFGDIATDKTMTIESMRVLMFLLFKTQMKNWVQLQQSEIAEALGMKQPNVSRALKKLVDKGILEATTKMGKAKNYRVSIDFGWRGTGPEYAKLRKNKDAQNIIDGKKRFARNAVK
jgi:predicted XRE-type DNA-binding protein